MDEAMNVLTKIFFGVLILHLVISVFVWLKSIYYTIIRPYIILDFFELTKENKLTLFTAIRTLLFNLVIALIPILNILYGASIKQASNEFIDKTIKEKYRINQRWDYISHEKKTR